ncbi:hypothetical protein BU14_0292s0003 [Porphyra umbilicalis]|uniref:Uncharacterized protein n=1 Tax=Porphyra umbilicalis TaxID=2786 RepID=A0A1X6P0S0_PORUM|nr:hypothetical protein BU14_0292s0003 [Porphyra umbilicalis]|eukprot:OSX74360.1 hypothetical protein BU14_0292s0003 [Porphyra umbilicalis]
MTRRDNLLDHAQHFVYACPNNPSPELLSRNRPCLRPTSPSPPASSAACCRHSAISTPAAAASPSITMAAFVPAVAPLQTSPYAPAAACVRPGRLPLAAARAAPVRAAVPAGGVTMRASRDSAAADLAAAIDASSSKHLLALANDTAAGAPIAEAAAALEAAAGSRGSRTAKSSSLHGVWSLAYTDAHSIVKNKGLTGSGKSLPAAKLAALREGYDADGVAWAEEKLSGMGGLKLRNRLIGTWAAGKARGGNHVELAFNEVETHPGGRTMASEAKEVIEVTYVDDDWKISRSPETRELFVFRREEAVGPAAPEEDDAEGADEQSSGNPLSRLFKKTEVATKEAVEEVEEETSSGNPLSRFFKK